MLRSHITESIPSDRRTNVILIGGSAGAGKSTIARHIANQFPFAHHLATGYLRESLRAYLDRTQYPELFHYTFRPPQTYDLIDTFCRQSELICRAVARCIERSYAEGTHIVIEGNHILPAYLQQHVTAYVILAVDDHALAERLHGPTHSARVLSLQDIHNIGQLQQFILKQAQQYSIPVIYNHTIEQTVAAIRTHMVS